MVVGMSHVFCCSPLLCALVLVQKHKVHKVKLVKRSKKNQRKHEHRSRMSEKAKLLLGDQEMADVPNTAAGKGSKKQRRKKSVTGKDTAEARDEAMME